ncbi:MAG: MBL fold metallo-hydrolase [Gemmatimonadetes bacterium]|nr:MBL fold metallo-hydrolase [Gemmatimonadota bacterium]
MNVVVLGSGSRGNAVAITSDDVTVLVDAGFSPRALRKRAAAAGVDLSRLAGVVLTHEHGDHARGAVALATSAGCELYASGGTLSRLGSAGRAIGQLETVAVGPFWVSACRTRHDAAEPIAVCVTGPEGEKLGIAYDLGEAGVAVRYLLRAADCLVVEANYDDVLLRTGPYPASVRERIAGSHGHLSNRAAAELLAELWHPGLRTVVLAHVSEQCNRPDLAHAQVRGTLEPLGYDGDLLVAPQDGALGPIVVLRSVVAAPA